MTLNDYLISPVGKITLPFIDRLNSRHNVTNYITLAPHLLEAQFICTGYRPPFLVYFPACPYVGGSFPDHYFSKCGSYISSISLTRKFQKCRHTESNTLKVWPRNLYFNNPDPVIQMLTKVWKLWLGAKDLRTIEHHNYHSPGHEKGEYDLKSLWL